MLRFLRGPGAERKFFLRFFLKVEKFNYYLKFYGQFAFGNKATALLLLLFSKGIFV